MKIKEIIFLIIITFGLVGCTNIKDLSYDDIINNLNISSNNTNTYRKGYSFYVPKGLSIEDAGTNYVILSSVNNFYYLFIDLVSYNSGKEIEYMPKENSLYFKKINYAEKTGYAEINLCENNKYLIEIMYNYAKIEVMVDESNINEALIKSINILNSVKYDDKIIEKLLADDNLTYTEEIFDMFEKVNSNSDILNYIEVEDETKEDTIKDTDFIN